MGFSILCLAPCGPVSRGSLHVHPESLLFLCAETQLGQLPGLPAQAEQGGEQKQQHEEGADDEEVEEGFRGADPGRERGFCNKRGTQTTVSVQITRTDHHAHLLKH